MNKIEKLLVVPKALFRSRKLIKNLYLSLYQYLILGKQNIELKLRNGDTIDISRIIYPRIIYYYYIGYIENITKDDIYFKINNKTFQVPFKEIENVGISRTIELLNSGWLYYKNYWGKNEIKFKHIYSSIYDIFIEEDYKILNVKDKDVLDIGAFVGDSSIYFILKGAKKVYAIEPHPEAYNEMIENIKLNNMEDRIIPINIGISYGSDYISVSTIKANTQYILLKPGERGYKIPAYNLSKLIDKYNIDAKILKMDCEGCEYDIILKDYDTIKNFDEIGFEYHAYNTKIPVSKLLEKLNKDFECKFIEGGINKKRGILHCIRKK
ncbi:MAG: FkbM family methyltransferase [Candidatus Nanopusillus sp.]